MVLQSAPRSSQIFGWAEPGDNITVVLRNPGPRCYRCSPTQSLQQLTVRAASDGAWSAQLAPVAAGGPFEIDVNSDLLGDGVTLVDVLFGVRHL